MNLEYCGEPVLAHGLLLAGYVGTWGLALCLFGMGVVLCGIPIHMVFDKCRDLYKNKLGYFNGHRDAEAKAQKTIDALWVKLDNSCVECDDLRKELKG